MLTWFTTLDTPLQILWVVAIISSVVFIIQFAMSVIGLGETDFDMDFDTYGDYGIDQAGAGSLYSIRSAVNFFLGFSWSGICLWEFVDDRVMIVIASILMGLLCAATFLYISRQMMKLQSSGNFDINDTVGKVCDVYLRIPPIGQGTGKVQISLGGSIQEFIATTQSGMAIPSGAHVRVVSVEGQSLVVEEL